MIPFAPVDVTRTCERILSAVCLDDLDSEAVALVNPAHVLVDSMVCHTEMLVLTGLSMWRAMTAIDALVAAQILRETTHLKRACK